jgi:S-adenosyl-L-methionine hydrolase (adenosine-forming)
MPVITLTTDLGLKDHYQAAVKGAIYKLLPEAIIVDISHQVEKYNAGNASFLVKNSFRDFPEGSVHIISVNDEPGGDKPFLAVESLGHYFIGTDTGVFSLILEDAPVKVVKLDSNEEDRRFPLRKVFTNAASRLIKGEPLESIGETVPGFSQKMELSAYAERDSIRGGIIYIDNYGNAITNIRLNHFQGDNQNRPFIIDFARDYSIDCINNSYGDVPEGEILARFNSAGYLEIAVNKGSAAQLIGLKLRGIIRIDFQ